MSVIGGLDLLTSPLSHVSFQVRGETISRIGPGLVALIGISTEDTVDEIQPLVNRILGAKLWNEDVTAEQLSRARAGCAIVQAILGDAEAKNAAPAEFQPQKSEEQASHPVPGSRKEGGEELWGGKPWKTNIAALQGEILCVSQFTLYGRLTKGTKPDFHKAMGGPQAKELYEQFLAKLREAYVPERIKDGEFGAMMDVSLVNDGPVTFILDTADKR